MKLSSFVFGVFLGLISVSFVLTMTYILAVVMPTAEKLSSVAEVLLGGL